MNRIIISSWCLLFISSFNLFGQKELESNELINALNEELFSRSTNKKVYLYDFLKTEEVNNLKIDSSILIRKIQPDARVVHDLLQKIMFTKDELLIDDILIIYSKQLDFFWKEWADLYLKNYYPPKELNEQYSILSSFETTLKSLQFRKENYSNTEIFEYYFSDKIFYDSLLMNIDQRCDLMKEYQDISPLYRKLNPCSIYLGKVSFKYIDPYLVDLKPYFLHELQNIDLKNWKEDKPSKSFYFFVKNYKIYNSYNDQVLGNFYINNYDQLKNENRHTLAFDYVWKNDNEALVRKLIESLIINNKEYQNYPYLEKIIRVDSDFNLKILLETLMINYKKHKETVENIILQLPMERSQKLLKEYSDFIELFQNNKRN